jgi:hypothetical protein
MQMLFRKISLSDRPSHNPRPSHASSQLPMPDDYHLGSLSSSMASMPDNINVQTGSVSRFFFSVEPPPTPTCSSLAFGLMSLEDQNVLEGLSNNAVLFSNMYSSDPNATPMPTKHHLSGHQRNHTFDGSIPISLPTPNSRKAETRLLREFWETYMRTPLGTSDLNSSLDRCPPSPNGPRRVRVASLPNFKTPTVEGTQPRYPDYGPSSTNATSSMRMTLHGDGDDL